MIPGSIDPGGRNFNWPNRKGGRKGELEKVKALLDIGFAYTY